VEVTKDANHKFTMSAMVNHGFTTLFFCWELQELVVRSKWLVHFVEEGIGWVYDAIRSCHREEDPYYVNIYCGNLLAYLKYTVNKAITARQLVEDALQVMEEIHRVCDADQVIPSSSPRF
jgi:hypothetical protein